MALKPEKYQPVACAVVDETGNVVNMIMADPALDAAPKGCALAARPAGSTVDVNWKVDAAAGKFEPKPELQAEAEAEGKAIELFDAVLVKAADADPVADEKP